MNEFIDIVFDRLLSLGIDPRLVALIIATLPVAEARLAIPIAVKCGLPAFEAFLIGFIGSSLPAPLLIRAFIPLVKRLAETKFMRKIGNAILGRIDDKAAKIKGKGYKRMAGVCAFVALPLPLTGVWTGCAVASVLDMGYAKALFSTLLGNLIASSLVVAISMTLRDRINEIMAIFTGIALLSAIILLLRAFRKKRRPD